MAVYFTLPSIIDSQPPLPDSPCTLGNFRFFCIVQARPETI
jgi:hypothetical protein